MVHCTRARAHTYTSTRNDVICTRRRSNNDVCRKTGLTGCMLCSIAERIMNDMINICTSVRVCVCEFNALSHNNNNNINYNNILALFFILSTFYQIRKKYVLMYLCISLPFSPSLRAFLLCLWHSKTFCITLYVGYWFAVIISHQKHDQQTITYMYIYQLQIYPSFYGALNDISNHQHGRHGSDI